MWFANADKLAAWLVSGNGQVATGQVVALPGMFDAPAQAALAARLADNLPTLRNRAAACA